MGKVWDGWESPAAFQRWNREWVAACYRVLKPGGHIVAFGGTRTWHRLAVAIEDAGFEMRDSLAWLYGSGFPKSHDVGKSTGDERYAGHGTALKPAFEPIVLARKPLAEKTVARNVLEHGTGAINVDACRIETDDNLNGGGYSDTATTGTFLLDGAGSVDELRALAAAGEKTPNGRDAQATLVRALASKERVGEYVQPSGRWPANVLLDQHAAAWVDEQSGVLKSGALKPYQQANREHYSGSFPEVREVNTPANEGGASRFFYTAKAPKRERPNVDGVQHPTVKPLAIMQWLIRLVTPPGGTVLDPFAGSGTTIEAALIEGFDPVGIEMEADYLPLIQHRIDRQAATLTA